jgi:hypothetical protein
MGAVKFWVTQLRILDREFFVIKELKMKFPGDPSVLARETKYFQTKELLAQTVRTIPTKQQNAILKAMNRRGMLGRVVRLPPAQYAQAQARLSSIGIEIATQVVPEPARED